MIPESLHDSELSLHSMSARQQFAGRFLPEDILCIGQLDQVGGVGLTVLELSHIDGALWR